MCLSNLIFYSSAFTELGNFTGSTGTHYLSTSDGLTVGTLYRIKWIVRSIIGFSEESDSLRVGFGAQAETPTDLAIDIDSSSSGTIAVTWSEVADGTLEILGYTLEMKGTNYEVIYDGSADPDTTSYIVTGLEPGAYYQFRVYSHNFNGLSEASDVLGAYA